MSKVANDIFTSTGERGRDFKHPLKLEDKCWRGKVIAATKRYAKNKLPQRRVPSIKTSRTLIKWKRDYSLKISCGLELSFVTRERWFASDQT